MKEEALCAMFVDWARAGGWRVYPEVANWDLVLEGGDDPKLSYNLQVGVHAKATANVKVLSQAIERRGPPIRYVMVPRATPDFIDVASALRVGVLCLEVQRRVWGRNIWLQPHSGAVFHVLGSRAIWDSEPLKLPPIEADLPAGVPSPKQLTQWRVKAIKICALARMQGYLTSHDFKRFGVSMTNWVRSAWILPTGKKQGRSKVYRLNEVIKDLPDKGWETVVEQLRKAGELDLEEIAE